MRYEACDGHDSGVSGLCVSHWYMVSFIAQPQIVLWQTTTVTHFAHQLELIHSASFRRPTQGCQLPACFLLTSSTVYWFASCENWTFTFDSFFYCNFIEWEGRGQGRLWELRGWHKVAGWDNIDWVGIFLIIHLHIYAEAQYCMKPSTLHLHLQSLLNNSNLHYESNNNEEGSQATMEYIAAMLSSKLG